MGSRFGGRQEGVVRLAVYMEALIFCFTHPQEQASTYRTETRRVGGAEREHMQVLESQDNLDRACSHIMDEWVTVLHAWLRAGREISLQSNSVQTLQGSASGETIDPRVCCTHAKRS